MSILNLSCWSKAPIQIHRWCLPWVSLKMVTTGLTRLHISAVQNQTSHFQLLQRLTSDATFGHVFGMWHSMSIQSRAQMRSVNSLCGWAITNACERLCGRIKVGGICKAKWHSKQHCCAGYIAHAAMKPMGRGVKFEAELELYPWNTNVSVLLSLKMSSNTSDRILTATLANVWEQKCQYLMYLI